MTIPHITAPACVPFLDQFRQIVISDKKLYVLRLLTGGHSLPQSILGRPSDSEWWHEPEPELVDASLMQYKMRTLARPRGRGAHSFELVRL